MASKPSNLDKAIFFQALFGLFMSVVASSCYHGLQKCLEEDNRSHFKENSVYMYNIVASIRDGFITLAIKFLHFFVAKSLQFRFSSMLQFASSIPSMLFWVAFTTAISSMSDDCFSLCNITFDPQ